MTKVTRVPARILVVDDDPAAREALCALLEGEGYGVVIVANGQEALTALRCGEEIGLIVMDLMMPVMDGLTFLSERARDPALGAVPVVVISALGFRGDLDVVAYLEKPIDPDELLSIVARYC